MDASERRMATAGRLDAFVDAAFAFAVTLLVIGGSQAPAGLQDLLKALGRLPAFAVSFALIALFWLGHRTYSGLAPVRTAWSTAFSLAIVFVVLVYVYPLRMLTESGAFYFSGGRLPGSELISSFGDLATLYGVYGLGFAVLAALYAGLYIEALRAGAGRLEAGPRRDLVDWAGSWIITSVAGVLSALLGWFGPVTQAPWLPGMAYFIIPVGIGLWTWILTRPAGRSADPKDR